MSSWMSTTRLSLFLCCLIFDPGRGTPSKKNWWGCAVSFLKPSPNFRSNPKFDALAQTPKSVTIRTSTRFSTLIVLIVMIKKYFLLKTLPIQYQNAQIILYFKPEWLKSYTLWCRTYLYSPCKGVPPGCFVRVLGNPTIQ